MEAKVHKLLEGLKVELDVINLSLKYKLDDIAMRTKYGIHKALEETEIK